MKLILARNIKYINEALYFVVLSDRCLVDIYSASQYFDYFGKIVFSTNLRRPSYELLLEK
jgi:hypothetical protein